MSYLLLITIHEIRSFGFQNRRNRRLDQAGLDSVGAADLVVGSTLPSSSQEEEAREERSRLYAIQEALHAEAMENGVNVVVECEFINRAEVRYVHRNNFRNLIHRFLVYFDRENVCFHNDKQKYSGKNNYFRDT